MVQTSISHSPGGKQRDELPSLPLALRYGGHFRPFASPSPEWEPALSLALLHPDGLAPPYQQPECFFARHGGVVLGAFESDEAGLGERRVRTSAMSVEVSVSRSSVGAFGSRRGCFRAGPGQRACGRWRRHASGRTSAGALPLPQGRVEGSNIAHDQTRETSWPGSS